MKERHVKPGEMLAMDPSRLHRGPAGDFFWMLGSSTTPNVRKGDIIEVTIRGELEHHAADAFGGESYEGILARVESAMKGEACGDEEGDDGDVAQASPPSAVLLCIDSPGGVVAGLNECVASLQKMKAQYKIPLYVYVNEMAASAAYAIACAADEIYCPPSAIVGSIGVISTMVSQARKNEKDGYDVRLLTSGARKADGHLHAPISDAALKVEMQRVNKLALAFFKIASKARGVSVDTIQSYEAGIFLGPEAVQRGLADGVLSYEDFLLGASQETPALKAGGNQTDRRVTKPKSEAVMAVALAALIKKTEAAIAKAKDPEKLSALYADLAAYKKTKKHVEHTETEEGADGDEEGDDDGDEKDDGDDKDSDKSEKFPAKDKGGEDDDEDEEEDEEEEEEESSAESEEKDAKAALSLIRSMTGMRGKKALGGARALFQTAINGAKDIAAMKKSNASREKKDLIASARGKYITRLDADWLGTQPLAVVKGFVETRRKQGVIVNTDDTTLVKPKHVEPGTEESLPTDTIEMIDAAVAGWAGNKETYRAELVKAHLAAHKKTIATATNGQGRI
jgi:ClpP class serine protease